MIVVSEIFLPLHPIKLTNNGITKFTFSSTFSLFIWQFGIISIPLPSK